MKKQHIIATVIFVTTIFLTSCATTGFNTSSNLTNVQLSSPNFRILATNVSGKASTKGLLGLSIGIGSGASQLALIPLSNDRMLYKTAMQQLWVNYEAEHGPVANKRLALINLRYDSETVNTFIFTKLTTAVIADVVEFQ